MKNKFYYIIIGLVICVMLITPFYTYAAVRYGEDEAVLLQEGEFDIPEYAESKQFSSNRNSSAEEYVYTQLLSYATNPSGAQFSINISSYNIHYSDIVAFYSNVINDHPDLFFVSSSIEYNYYPGSGNIANIFPEFSMSSNEVVSAWEAFSSCTQKALSCVDSSMNDLQKAVVLHDYVCSHAHYPNVDLNTEDKGIFHSAYGFCYDGEIVCAGYTLIYSYLLNSCGVPCEYVASDSMGHAWNKVKIDGSWYNVDCTWDDHDGNSPISVQGSVTHFHMLKSDSKFSTEECSYHYDSYTYDDCPANSTLYDTAFWDDVTSCIYVVNGDFYYLDSNFSNAMSSLTRRTLSGEETVIYSRSASVQLGFSTIVYDSNNVEHTVSRSDLLARITYLDNRFYISFGRSLKSVFPDGSSYDILRLSSYPTGLAVRDNNLIYQFYNSQGTVNEIDKLQYYNDYFTTVKGTNYNNYPDINNDGVINAKDYAMIIK